MDMPELTSSSTLSLLWSETEVSQRGDRGEAVRQRGEYRIHFGFRRRARARPSTGRERAALEGRQLRLQPQDLRVLRSEE